MSWKLDSFEILKRIGGGGMAWVFEGRHENGLEVAIKAMRGEHATHPRYRQAFVREATAAVRLQHQSIVTILDFGEVSEDVATRSSLSVHAPYLVMELVPGGTLTEVADELGWRDLRTIALDLLDALAHAHARDVVHRDIKPANVLCWRDVDGRLRVKLTDFGVARGIELEDAEEIDTRVTGTPRYMAPEQIAGARRDQGPWTDLYALGAMLWRILCGEAPFVGETSRILHDHLHTPLPEFSPMIAVPDGFEPWLRRLLEKDPTQRFQRAHDALRVLQTLSTHDSGGFPKLVMVARAEETKTDITPIDGVLTYAPRGAGLDVLLPTTWRRNIALVKAVPDVGLGIFPIREVPFVHRHAERDVLWAYLGRAAGGLEVAQVVGERGLGRRRLVRWISQRAHELGVSYNLRAVHEAGLQTPLGSMVGRFTNTLGLSRSMAAERLSRMGMSVTDADILASLVSADTRMTREEDQWSAVARMIRLLSADRIVIMWLHEPRVAGTAGFLEYLQRNHKGLRALVIVTQRDVLPGIPIVPVMPMEDEELDDMLSGVVTLHPDLRARILQEASGSPAFALQLLGNWILRRLLISSPEGYRLAGSLPIPKKLDDIWHERLDTFFAEGDVERHELLELAAVLGRDVSRVEWCECARGLGLEIPWEFEEALVRHGLAVKSSNGWSFANAYLHDELCEMSRIRKVWRRYNRLAARVIREVHPLHHHRETRIARHLEAARDLPESLEAWLRAGLWAFHSGDFDVALACERAYLDTVETLELGEGDVRRGATLRMRCGIALRRGQKSEFEGLSAAAIVHAREKEWTPVLAMLLAQLAEGRILSGNVGEIPMLLQEAVSISQTLREPQVFVYVSRIRGSFLNYMGDSQTAVDVLAEASRAALEAGDRVEYAACVWESGDALRSLGALQAAEEAFAQALSIYTELGSIVGCGWCTNALGDMARMNGEFEKARELFWSAKQIFEGLNSRETVIVDFNLAQVDLEEGYPTQARDMFRRALASAQERGMTFYMMMCRLGLLACAAANSGLGNLEAILVEVEREAALMPYREPDVLKLLHHALRFPMTDDVRVRIQALIASQHSNSIIRGTSIASKNCLAP